MTQITKIAARWTAMAMLVVGLAACESPTSADLDTIDEAISDLWSF